jgi:tRNA dimethylallyltransferase
MMEGPEPDLELRARLYELDLTDLRQRLERIDPDAARRIHPNDRKRTIRAIEVFEKTGTPLSRLQTQWGNEGAEEGADDQTLIIGLEYPVETINRRINARVKHMIDEGLIEEVSRLHTANAMGRNAREALGYKQIIDALEGRCTMEEAAEQIKIRTRRFAKQQRTWLRRFRTRPNSAWINADMLDTQELADKALAEVLRLVRSMPARI